MSWLSRFMSFFKKEDENIVLLGENVASSKEALEKTVLECHKDIQKSVRRLSLAQKQVLEQQEQLTGHMDEALDRLGADKALVLNMSDTLRLIDRLDAIKDILKDNKVGLELTGEVIKELQSRAQISPLCQLGEPYPEENCQVVGTMESDVFPQGYVTSVTEQGYRARSGATLRSAKVIVAKAPLSIPNMQNGEFYEPTV